MSSKQHSTTSDLTTTQSDYAIYLPAISSAYTSSLFANRRHPKTMSHLNDLNFFDKDAIYSYDWALYSAGHARLDLTKNINSEQMIHTRGSHTTLLADSGGFQIGKGRWEGKWADPSCPKAEKKRSLLLNWLCHVSDYSMVLDIPSWTYQDAEVAEKVGIHSFQDAITATKFNNDYFIQNAEKNTKFLNVVQGNSHAEVFNWYRQVKDYPFSGWAFGGQSTRDLKIILELFVHLIYDGLLEEGEQDWVHFLGVGRMHWAVALTQIQRLIRQTHNKNLTISLDSASPFLSTVNATIYTGASTEDKKNWTLSTARAIDDKMLTNDPRNIADFYDNFLRNPVTEQIGISDICVRDHNYPSDSLTSWDTQSYILIMANNVWQQINSIQEANRRADMGAQCKLLVDERFTKITFNDVAEQVFNAKTKEDSLRIIDKYAVFLQDIPMSGQAKVSAEAQFSNLFAVA
jgi:hypothetical protein